MSGSYIRIEGVFEAFRKPISIKSMALKLHREKDDRVLNLQWSTFVSPVNQSFAGNYASSVESAHPFKIEADSITCAFTEFCDTYNSAGKTIEPHFNKLIQRWREHKLEVSNYCDAVAYIQSIPEYSEVRNAIEKEFYWEIGKYLAIIQAQYDDRTVSFQYGFFVSEYDYEKLHQNIDSIVLAQLKSNFGISWKLAPVVVELKESITTRKTGGMHKA